jgi:hypothetical protein
MFSVLETKAQPKEQQTTDQQQAFEKFGAEIEANPALLLSLL